MACFIKRQTKRKGTVWDVVFLVNDGEQKTQKKLSGFPTKRDAQRAYEKYITNPPPVIHRASTTKDSVSDAVKKYLDSRKNIVAETTLMHMRIRFRKYVLSYFGSRRITDITKSDVVLWVGKIWDTKNNKGNPLAQGTCVLIFSSFSFFMKWACDAYSLNSNPFDGVMIPKRREQKRELHVWTEEQFNEFIENVSSVKYKVFFSVLFYSGCRKNEVNALTAEDFTKEDDHYSIKISKSMALLPKGEIIITPPKTASSNRTVGLPSCLTPMLDDFLKDKSGYLWKICPTRINAYFGNVIRKTNLPYIRPHDLRHSHASLLIASGIPVTTVSKRLGHSMVRTTVDTYSHPVDSNEKNVQGVLDDIWEKIATGWKKT